MKFIYSIYTAMKFIYLIIFERIVIDSYDLTIQKYA